MLLQMVVLNFIPDPSLEQVKELIAAVIHNRISKARGSKQREATKTKPEYRHLLHVYVHVYIHIYLHR